MNRFKDQDGRNELLLEAGDTGFLGVNTRLDPGILRTGAAWRDVNETILGPGIASHARNCRFRRGVAETRGGSIAPRCFNPVEAVLVRQAKLYDGIRVRQNGTLVGDFVLAGAPVNGRPAYNGDAAPKQCHWTGTEWYLAWGVVVPSVETSSPDDVERPWLAAWPDGITVESAKVNSGDGIELENVWSEQDIGRTFIGGPIHGTGTFSDPDGLEWLMVAGERGVYMLRDGQTPWIVEVPGVIDGPVDLVQTFDSVVMLRGFAKDPLAWDGTRGGAFASIQRTTPPDSTDYTEAMPRAETGVVMANRLFVVQDRDSIAVSDILDATRYDPEMSVFRLNSGEDDRIVGLFPHRRNNLLVLKEQSIHAITGITAALSSVQAEVINPNIGCAARRSVAAVGGDVYFLSHTGVFKISEVVEQSMQTGETPVSEPVEDIVQRINWEYAHTACALVAGDTYRLSVPVDGATEPNIVLVYDTVRGTWQGYDTYPDGFHPDRFARADWCGRKRPVGIDTIHGIVAVLDCGEEDFVIADNEATAVGGLWPEFGPSPIITEVRTRGYMLPNHAGFSRFRHGQVTLETWNPNITISTVTDGVEETDVVISGLTRSRTAYAIHGWSAWDPTNADNDHGTRGREDYSVVLPDDDGMELGTGVVLNRMQQFQQHFPIRRHGGWIAIQVASASGRIAMRQASIDGGGIRNANKTKQ